MFAHALLPSPHPLANAAPINFKIGNLPIPSPRITYLILLQKLSLGQGLPALFCIFLVKDKNVPFGIGSLKSVTVHACFRRVLLCSALLQGN